MTTLNKLIPNNVIKVLHAIQRGGYKSALLAGGALRDLYFGKPVSDYDIFVWDPKYSNEQNDEQKMLLWGSIFPECDMLQRFDTKGYDGSYLTRMGTKLTAVWDVCPRSWRNVIPKYQIIYTQFKPIDHVNKYFDVGLCKAYCDGQHIRYTADFMRDVKDKTFTICGEDMSIQQYEYTITHHIPKMSLKYPNFTTRLATHNWHFIDLKF